MRVWLRVILLGLHCAAASNSTAGRLKNKLVSRSLEAKRKLFTAGTIENYDPGDCLACWSYTALGTGTQPSSPQQCTTSQPNLDYDLCQEWVAAEFGTGVSLTNQEGRVTGCWRHKSNTNFYYNRHADGNSGWWNQQRVVCRNQNLVTEEPSAAPPAAPTTAAPTPPPTFPTGWPTYYTWGNDVDACPCSHQSVPQYVGGNLVDSGEGCHDILTEADCLTAFASLFPGTALPIFHGHVDDPDLPRGCAWTEVSRAPRGVPVLF